MKKLPMPIEDLENLIETFQRLKEQEKGIQRRIQLLQEFFMKEMGKKKILEIGQYQLQKIQVERPYLKVEEIVEVLGKDVAKDYLYYAKQRYVKVFKKAA